MDSKPVVCNGKYHLEKLIGEGAFGKIYSGTNFFAYTFLSIAHSDDSKVPVAIKLVSIHSFLCDSSQK